MELRHLRYFLAVVEARNFTRAAAHCHVAQSALSQQIGRLETTVGSTLFARTSRSVRPTAAGELLVPLARRILAEVDDAQAALDALRGVQRGRLRLGLIQTMASAVDIVDVVGEFHREYPGIELVIGNEASRAMVASLEAGELDAAVVGLSPGELPPALTGRLLAEDPLVAVTATRGTATGDATVDLADLADLEHFIWFRPGSGLRSRVAAAFARAGVEPGTRIGVDQVEDMVRLAIRRVGPTIVPLSTVRRMDGPHLVSGTVLGLSDPEAFHPVTVVHDARRTSPATSAFLEILDRFRTTRSSPEPAEGSAPGRTPTHER